MTTPMNALSRLIRTRMEELDLSYPDVARRGGFKTHSTIHSLATKAEHKQPPRPDTLMRLAKGLELPLDLVRAAASEAAGYQLLDIPTTLEAAEDVRVVVAHMNELSAKERRRVRRMVVAFLNEADAENTTGDIEG